MPSHRPSHPVRRLSDELVVRGIPLPAANETNVPRQHACGWSYERVPSVRRGWAVSATLVGTPNSDASFLWEVDGRPCPFMWCSRPSPSTYASLTAHHIVPLPSWKVRYYRGNESEDVVDRKVGRLASVGLCVTICAYGKRWRPGRVQGHVDWHRHCDFRSSSHSFTLGRHKLVERRRAGLVT